MSAAPLELRLEAARAEAYLAADPVIEHHHPLVRREAARLRGDTAADSARAAYSFVRDGIRHSRDIDRWSAACTASEVLAAGDAICHGKSHLLVALLRAQGIPAGLCYQRLGGDRPGDFFVHGLVAIELDGRWLRLDARGNRPGIDARFSLDGERLAYPVDPSLGEIDYPVVHAAVPPALLTALADARPGEPGFGYVPSEL
jgi:transglutaminase-like putative cysteine protease